MAMAKNGKLYRVGTWLWSTRVGNRWLSLCPLLLGGAIAAAIRLLNIRLVGLLDGCSFLWLTGWRCPGCGGTRMLEALLHGRIGEAVYYNPLILVLFAAAVAVLLFVLLRTFRREWRPLRWNGRTLLWLILPVVVVSFWLLRNTTLYQRWFF